MFNATQVKDDIVDWIKRYFEYNASPKTKAIIGISGGKDSTTVAALCVEALGPNRVVGVLMPNAIQADIDYSKQVCGILGIEGINVDIGGSVNAIYSSLANSTNIIDMRTVQRTSPMIKGFENNTVVTHNIPARIRMVTLYAISAAVGGRVANTSNLSEDYVGWATKFGDTAGDFAPLMDLTCTEVKAIGAQTTFRKRCDAIPSYNWEDFILKTPLDGLCGITDEESFGFTYKVLDRYIRTGECDDQEIREKIIRMHEAGRHKMELIRKFNYNV